MDPRSRADELLARARARGAFVVTPDNMTSPMDASSTVRIPRATIAEACGADPDSTMVISTGQHQPQQPVPQQQDSETMWPQTDQQASYQQPGRGEHTSLYAALTPEEPQQGQWGQYPPR